MQRRSVFQARASQGPAWPPAWLPSGLRPLHTVLAQPFPQPSLPLRRPTLLPLAGHPEICPRAAAPAPPCPGGLGACVTPSSVPWQPSSAESVFAPA